MKKIFTLFAAMLLALTASADRFEITPTKWKGGTVTDQTLYRTLDATQSGIKAGDTIVLADGTYTELSSLPINSAVVIMAADKAAPVVNCSGYFDVYASVEVIGIKFNFEGSAGNGYGFYVHNDAHKYIKLEGCEMYDYPKPCLTIENGAYLCDSVIINNCYFRDCTSNAIKMVKSSIDGHECTCDSLIVSNSTFKNFESETDLPLISFDTKTDNTKNAKLVVNHCTFYNILKTGTGTYGIIDSRKSINVLVENSLFANPSATAPDGKNQPKATQLYGGTVLKCLRWNVPAHRNTPSTGNDINEDPLFVDATITLSEESPAIGAGTDGKTLGDPRWWPVITYPETDFADGYAFTGTAASLESGLIKEDHWGAGREYIRYDGGMHSFAAASWTIEATRACFVKVKVYTATNSWEGHDSNPYGNSGHNFSVELYNEDMKRLDTIAEGVYEPSPWDGYRNYPADGIELGTIIVPAAGIYTIKLKNMRDFSRCGVDSVTFTYLNDIPTVKSHGSWDYEHDAVFDLAEDGKSASTTLNLAQSNTNYSFKMVIGEEWRANGHNYNREYTSASGITSNGNDMSIYVNYTGEHKLTWYFKENKFEITFPVIPDPVFYVAGTFTDWETNKVAMTEEAGICTASITLDANTDTYAYKILKIDAWGTKTWYGAENEGARMTFGNSTNWQLTTTGGGQNINLTSTLAGEYPFIFNAADAHMSVTIPDPSATAIDNTVVGEKAVKLMENGQIVIIKNGVRYNVLGTVIK